MPSILPALRALLFASVVVPLILIAGCGLKGELVLPGPDEASSSQPEDDEEPAEESAQNRDGAAG